MGYNRINIELLAADYGLKNLRFFIPMRPVHSLHALGLPIGFEDSNDEEVMQECVADERRYKVDDGYKIELRAINGGAAEELDQDETYYGSKTFYQMDLASLINRHPDIFRIYALVDEDNKYERVDGNIR